LGYDGHFESYIFDTSDISTGSTVVERGVGAQRYSPALHAIGTIASRAGTTKRSRPTKHRTACWTATFLFLNQWTPKSHLHHLHRCTKTATIQTRNTRVIEREMQVTTTTVQAVVAAAQQLSPTEQLEVIQALTRVLQQRYPNVPARTAISDEVAIFLPATVRRAPLVTDLHTFAADFWPEHETADDINNYLAQQRSADRLHDLPERE
jgi:hypothetical protein